MISIKKNQKVIYVCILVFVLLVIFSNRSYAAYPKLVSKLNKAFETIQDWLTTLATPAAAISVTTGLFMKKFSFGDEEKIRTGKKLIKTALFSYGFVIVINLVLTTIANLLT